MKKFTLFIVLISVFSIYGQSTSGYSLLADYPFISDLADATGNYGDAYAQNAPFQNGGIYLNGIYQGSGDPNLYNLYTDDISSFNTNDFIIKLDFKSDVSTYNDILLCGSSWRWLQVFVDSNGKLKMYAVDVTNYYLTIDTNFTVNANTWYSLGIAYTDSNHQLKVYIDNNLVKTEDLGSFTFTYHNDFIFTPQNGGLSTAMKGYWRNFKVYGNSSASVSDVINDELVRLYPNPSKGIINIDTKKEIHSVTVYDMTGKSVSVNYTDNKIFLNDLNKGIYLVQINVDGELVTRKIIVN